MLKIQLLGQPKIEFKGTPVAAAHKQVVLLAYIGLEGEVPRTELETLFFSGAKGGLSDTLRPLPKEVQDCISWKNQEFVTFADHAEVWIDGKHFLEKVGRLAQQSPDELWEAFHLYQGDFTLALPRFTTSELEDWLEEKRRKFKALYNELLLHLQKTAIEQRDATILLQVMEHATKIDGTAKQDKTKLMLRLRLLGILGRYTEVEDLYKGYEKAFLPTAEDSVAAVRRKILFNQQDPSLEHDLWSAIIRSEQFCPTPNEPIELKSSRELEFVTRPEFAQVQKLAQTLLTDERTAPRIIVLAGMGGVGKTALVRELARRRKSSGLFPNGVLWGSLGKEGREQTILSNWVFQLSKGVASNLSFSERFQELTAACERLFVIEDEGNPLDRPEDTNKQYLNEPITQLPEGLDTIVQKMARLVPSGSSNTVIITTRNKAIGLSLQQVYHYADVHVIEMNPVEMPVALRILRHYAATLNRGDEEALVHALEGLPLALELAGKYIREQKKSIADYLNLFKDTSRQIHYLLPKINSVFEISRRALMKRLRDRFDELAVFSTRSFDVQAAAAVWDDPQLELVSQQLESLAALSLVQVEGERYRLHALLSRFALEYLEDKPQFEAIHQRMHHYYLTLPKANTPIAILLPERDSLEYALDTAYAQGLYADYINCVENMRRFWFSQGLYDVAREAYLNAAEAAARLDDRQKQAYFLILAAETLLEQGGDEAYQQARAYIDQGEKLLDTADLVGRFYVHQARARLALEMQQEGFLMRDELGHLDDLMEELYETAPPDIKLRYIDARLWSVSQAFYDGWQAKPENIDMLVDLTAQMLQQIDTLVDTDDTDYAYERALSRIKGLGKQNGVLLWAVRRKPELAELIEANYQQIRQLCDEIGEYAELAPVLNYHIIFLRSRGEINRALELAYECEQLGRNMGDIKVLTRTLFTQSTLYELRKAWENAYEKALECIQVLQERGLYLAEKEFYNQVLLQAGFCAAALCHFDEAITTWETIAADNPPQPDLLKKYFEIVRLVLMGDPHTAIELNNTFSEWERLDLGCLEAMS